MKVMAWLAGAAALCAASSAKAADEAFELWLNPSASAAIDDDTSFELETAQRLRSAGDGRADTYFARAWLNQDIADGATLSGALEHRINDGGADENRLIQQLSTRHGLFRTRLRFEQRFVHDDDRMGLRVRPRVGAAIPLDEAERWTFRSDAELFLTLRSTSAGGDEGLTGLRTQIGVSYEVNDRVSVSAAYLRQQDFRDGGPDRVAHAPLIGLELAF